MVCLTGSSSASIEYDTVRLDSVASLPVRGPPQASAALGTRTAAAAPSASGMAGQAPAEASWGGAAGTCAADGRVQVAQSASNRAAARELCMGRFQQEGQTESLACAIHGGMATCRQSRA